MIETLLSLDTALLIEARGLVPDSYATLIQIFGESIVIFVAVFLLVLWLYGVSRKDNAYKIAALQIFTTIILTFIVYSVVNFGIDTWRPSPQDVVGGLTPLIPHPLDNSFPSGHALFTAAFLIGAMRFFGNNWALVGGVLFGVITALARVIGGVHYPGDIIGGWVFGSIGALVLIHLVDTGFFRVYIFSHIVRIASFFRL